MTIYLIRHVHGEYYGGVGDSWTTQRSQALLFGAPAELPTLILNMQGQDLRLFIERDDPFGACYLDRLRPSDVVAHVEEVI